MKLISHCPTCGAPLTQAPKGNKVTCTYCGAVTTLDESTEAQVYKAPASVPEPEPAQTPEPTPQIEILSPKEEFPREEEPVRDVFEVGHGEASQADNPNLTARVKKLGGWLIGLLVLVLLILIGCCIVAVLLFQNFGNMLQ